MMRQGMAVTLAVSLVVMPVLVSAEVVYLKDGTVVTGSVISQDAQSMKVKTEFGDMTIPKDKIKSIDYQGVVPGTAAPVIIQQQQMVTSKRPTVDTTPKPKSKQLAMALAAALPGAGFFYTEDYLWGVVDIAASGGAIAGMVVGFMGKDVPGEMYCGKWCVRGSDEWELDTTALAISIPAYVVIRVASVIAAYYFVDDYNERLAEQLKNEEQEQQKKQEGSGQQQGGLDRHLMPVGFVPLYSSEEVDLDLDLHMTPMGDEAMAALALRF